MNQERKTLELAKIYEEQGYDRDALDIYSFLDDRESNLETRAGKDRLEAKVKKQETPLQKEGEPKPEPLEKIAGLFEKWVILMLFKQRLKSVNKIKTR